MSTVVPGRVAGVRFRPSSPADAAAVHALLLACYDSDGTQERETLEDVEELFATPWWDPAADGLVGEDADGRVVAFGTARRRPGQLRTRQSLLHGDVHPQARARGVGRALLAWQTARGEELLRGPGTTEDVPRMLRVFCEDHLGDRVRLLRAAGFEPRRYSATMRRDLSLPLAPAVPPPNVRLLALPGVVDDLQDAARRAHNAAFADHWGSEPIEPDDWRRSCVQGPGARPDLSSLALAGDGAVVGYLISGTYPQDWQAQGFSEGWTDLLGVSAAHRRQGIAKALLLRAMSAYREAGLQQAGLAVDVDNPRALRLYAALGYTEHARETSWVRDLSGA